MAFKSSACCPGYSRSDHNLKFSPRLRPNKNGPPSGDPKSISLSSIRCFCYKIVGENSVFLLSKITQRWNRKFVKWICENQLDSKSFFWFKPFFNVILTSGESRVRTLETLCEVNKIYQNNCLLQIRGWFAWTFSPAWEKRWRMCCVKTCPSAPSTEAGPRGVLGPVVRGPVELEALNAVSANVTCHLLLTVDGLVSDLRIR